MVDTLNDITSALQTYVVSPLNAFGIGGYVFDVQTEEKATLAADITDHYTEDNIAVQDHIAIKPKRVTLRGYVGELVYNGSNNNNNGVLQQVTQKLTILAGYLPQVSAATEQAQAAISAIDGAGGTAASFAAAVPAAANIYGLVQDAIGTTGLLQRQQAAYQYFAACQYTKTLMGIQTPWEFLTNMAVEMIDAIQSEDSIFITDFAVTFKQMRFAVTQTATAALNSTGGIVPGGQTFSQGVAALQGAPQTNIGIGQGQPSIVSLSNLANNPLANIFSHSP